jgi:DNA-binding GntR family transcriptional regulator
MAEVVFDQLKLDIITGRIKAGDRLVERELTDRFQVSRTPMRQALKQLVHVELAVEIPYRGVIVRSLSHEFARDIYDLRLGIEGLSAFLAAQRGSAADLKDLERIFHQIDVATVQGARDEVLVLNSEFHTAIARATSNQLLVTRVDELWTSINLVRAAAWKGNSRTGSSREEHYRIMAAILERDPVAARTAMEEHVQASWQLVDLELSATGKAQGKLEVPRT